MGSSVCIGVGREITLRDYDLCIQHAADYGLVLFPKIPSSDSAYYSTSNMFQFHSLLNALLWNPGFIYLCVLCAFCSVARFWALFTVLVPYGVYRPRYSRVMLKSISPNCYSLTSDIIWHFSHFSPVCALLERYGIFEQMLARRINTWSPR